MSTRLPLRASVIVATYRRARTLVQTLEGLAVNVHPSLEIIVVDQTREYDEADEAAVLEACTRLGVRYVSLDIVSLTYARNVGLRHATGEIVIFCDDDVLVDENYVSAHVRCYDEV